MNVLGFDTATAATAVAVLSDGRQFEARDDPPPGERPRHATRLLPLVHEVLARAGLEWAALDRLAVGVGPGSFTGLRIGVATARGLAHAAGLPLLAVSTLRALAAGAQSDARDRPVAAIIDARRGEVFAAAWAGSEPVLEPSALAPETLGERVRGLTPAPLAVGDGAVRFRDQLEASGAAVPVDVSPLHRVDAGYVCRLAAHDEPGPPDAVVPLYLRIPDADRSP